MKRSSILLSTYLIFTLFNASCKKQAPACTGNCGTINANGDVINKLTNASAGGVPVLLSWVKFVGGFSQSEVITTVNSKSDGTFNFLTNVKFRYINYVVTKPKSALVSSNLSICFLILFTIPNFLFSSRNRYWVGGW